MGAKAEGRFVHSDAILILAALVSASAVANADPGEMLCVNTKLGPPTQGSTIACYSDASCTYAAALGGDPIRDFDPASAPFALARGKIGAIVAAPGNLIEKIRTVGGSCSPIIK